MLVGGTDGFCCPHHHGSVESLLVVLLSQPVDVILMDIELPGMSGIEGTRRVKALKPDCEVLMLTIYEENDKVFDALCAGASGYLVKKTPPAQILDAIRDAAQGGSPMSSHIARKVVQHLQRRPPEPGHDGITDRERQILQALAQGNGYRAIGHDLHISVDTVRFHIRNIYEKLQVHSQSQAVAQAVRRGLID